MTPSLHPPRPISDAHRALMFPTLTPAQVARIATHGTVRETARDQVLIEAGDAVVPFFVVCSGRIDIIQPSSLGDTLVVAHGPGQFTGEGNLLLSRRSLLRAVVSEPGEVIQFSREQVLGLVQTDAEVSDILMRAFIYRRMELIATGGGDVMLIGSAHSAGTLRAREFLARNGQYEGSGIYYSATFMEAQVCSNEEVIVVGGGNSAGQAAVFLAQTSKHVHVLVRSGALAETMSRYLIRRIEESPSISVRTHTEIIGLEGNAHLERVRVQDKASGALQTLDIRHVFMMTGALPNTMWLDGCIALDSKGFIKTGPDLTPDDLASAQWPVTRPPLLLETSRPGVFAVGDVRGGNVKRVASAVGEGSIAVFFVHRVLAE